MFSALDQDQDGLVTEVEFVRQGMEDEDLVFCLLGRLEEDKGPKRRCQKSVERRTTTFSRYYNLCKHRCGKCTYASKTRAVFQEHMAQKHGEEDVFKSPYRPAVSDRGVAPSS